MIVLVSLLAGCTCRGCTEPEAPPVHPPAPAVEPEPVPEPPEPANLDPGTMGSMFYSGPVGEVYATGKLPDGATSCFPNLVILDGRLERRAGGRESPGCEVVSGPLSELEFEVRFTSCDEGEVLSEGPHVVTWPDAGVDGQLPKSFTLTLGEGGELVFHRVSGSPSSLFSQCTRTLEGKPAPAPSSDGGAVRRKKPD